MDHPIFDLHGHHGPWKDFVIDGAFLDGIARSENIRNILVSNLEGIETPGAVPGIPPLKDQCLASRETLELCRERPFLLPAFVCQPGFCAADTAIPLLDTGEFRALKFHPYFLGLDADDSAYDPFLDLAARYDLPVVIHAAPGCSDPAKIYRLARRHPRVRVVLYHINLTGDLDYGLEVIASALERGDANLWAETSWVPPAYVLKAVEACGFDRVLFGTDIALDGETHYRFYYPVFEAIERKYGRKALSRFLYGTNEDFLG